jgi:O-acetylserine/cysteine efflux transporter
MKPSDIALAVGVAVIWGLAFVVSKIGLRELSPAMICALRFVVAAIPCLFVPKPKIAWSLLIAIGLSLFLAQFLAQNYGLAHGVPPGLMSVIVQMQALFTVALAALVLGEWPTRAQIIGLGIAVVGLAMICGTVGYDFSVQTFALSMISPMAFAIGNLLLRRTGDVKMFDLTAWLSIVPPLPLLVLAFATEGAEPAMHSLLNVSWAGIACILFLGIASTSAAYGAWGHLLRSYTAAQVVPFALLVPFTAALSSLIVFGETFGPMRLGGMMIVVAGIAVMLLLGRIRSVPRIAS